MMLTQIWRYPVKSMAGERLESATLGALGIEGDRVVHVEDARGRLITARTHPGLLGFHANLNSSGEPVVDGSMWTDPEVMRRVAGIVGPDAKLVRDDTASRFDVLPLLVATDGAIGAFGFDGRRLRPNIVVGGVDGLAEREWPGNCLHIGRVLIGVQDLRLRCVMTSYDPDSMVQDKEITRGIYQRFEGKLALNCFVIQGGQIAVGDEVTLEVTESSAEASSAGP